MDILLFSGLLAAIWMVVGVAVAASRYPGYSHSRQFCSELGAAGSPTQKFSPLINNYPLGILFCLFGYYLLTLPDAPGGLQWMGGLIILHGVATWVAGYFPMDADAYTATPSWHCQIHSWAGMLMLLSLLIAPLLSFTLSDSPYLPGWFQWFSLACVIATLFFTLTLAKAYKAQSNPGLHQRLSYGAQLVWLAGLSVTLWMA
ncbi:DUF998 domain-containing protein [Bowmanella sp. Y26]|uniref:DUF998 domain-containing protein n=1 Tax=Bowmanella yangjiangensis TaxID=2811230 RepID=UPI001BDDC74D|nr:DUF998 domain-containing protein [Bowmanella yangjiangensis]MBT1064115.1 DUF998 domain-containing protein [Bowmanella yangjiangensis]